MKLSGKIFCIALLTAVIAGAWGCKKKQPLPPTTMEVLQDKYGQGFVELNETVDPITSMPTINISPQEDIVAPGATTPIPRPTTTAKEVNSKVWKDGKNNKFIVKEYDDGTIKDNYNSVLYDEHAQAELQQRFGQEATVFVSTESEFWGSDTKFTDLTDYIQKCYLVNIAIYVTKETSCYDLAPTLMEAYMGSRYLVTIYQTTPEHLAKIKEFEDKLPENGIINTQRLIIDDNALIVEDAADEK